MGVRFSLADFTSIAVLDVAAGNAALVGFYGGFTDGTYGDLVPHYNGAYHGNVVRFSLADFTTVAVLDVAAGASDLRGFRGSFTDGTYGYLVPYTDGTQLHGNVVRFP